MTQNNPSSRSCRECLAGLMRLHQVTYFTWLDDELVSVPNFPAWVCDICGRREYDRQAITWLTAMLDPEAGKPTSGTRLIHAPQDGKQKPLRPTQAK